MKKKVRKIMVGGQSYLWRAVTESPGILQLRIWRMPETTPWAIVHEIRFDDPFYFFPELISCEPGQIRDRFQLNPVTPGIVAKFIQRIPDAGGNFHPAGDGQLMPHVPTKHDRDINTTHPNHLDPS